jgi:exopolysaccharide production protein ExoZ
MRTERINSLQMLRAIAVMLIIFIHLTNFILIPRFAAYSAFWSFFALSKWPAIGVDLFFVISGFIMTVVTPQYILSGNWQQFLLKRAIRIIPLYYLVSLYIFITGLRHGYIADNTIILKSVLFLPLFDKKIFVVPLVPVGWSLSYEIYFYLLITVFLIFKKDVYKNLLCVIGVLAAIGVVFDPPQPLLKFLTSPLLLEFAYGIIVGLLYRNKAFLGQHRGEKVAFGLTLIGAILMLVTLFSGTASYDFSLQENVENNNTAAILRAVVWGLPCAFFLFGIVLMEESGCLFVPAFMVRLGDASYSAYLTHILFYQLYSKVFVRTHLSANVFVLSGMLVCLICTLIFYRIVEKPLNTVISKWLIKRSHVLSVKTKHIYKSS